MQQRVFSRFYSVPELYVILHQGLRTMPRLAKARKAGLLSAHFAERIMLAVTEVNGCEICSYAHTRMALESGMGMDEIRLLLAGDTGAIPADEALAIVFSQHYADTRGRPTREAWQRTVDAYGLPKALGILGAARVMMIGNASGIAVSAFVNRLRGKPVAKSSLHYEVAMLLAVVIFFPFALAHAMMSALLGRSIIGFGRPLSA
jgi:AhpD family alkylhydroperoxidase